VEREQGSEDAREHESSGGGSRGLDSRDSDAGTEIPLGKMASSYVSGRLMSDQTEHSRAIMAGYVRSGHYFRSPQKGGRPPKAGLDARQSELAFESE
jgi:hypothetical protein